MSGEVYITPAEVRPGMHVEIVQRPWRGVVRSPLAQGRFTAEADDGEPLGFECTSWSVDAIGWIRLLANPLPTARHARIIARVDRHSVAGWRVLTRYTDDDDEGRPGGYGWTPGEPWRSDVPVDGLCWHGPEHITEWRALATDSDSLGDEGTTP